MKDALSLFDSIPASQHPSKEPVQFTDYDLHDTFTPRIFSLDGSDVKPRGPIRLTEIRRRQRMRFVRVDFYDWKSAPSGQMFPKKYMSSYAWQGENAIHLLEQPTIFDVDPFGDDDSGSSSDPGQLDLNHARLLKLQGVSDSHLDLF